MDKDYLEARDISWLRFNERVLEEAFDEKKPIAERLKYISIFYSNLDEFYMVRIATLKLLKGKKDNLTGRSYDKILKESLAFIQNVLVKADYVYSYLIKNPLIKNDDFGLFKIDELNSVQISIIDNYYEESLKDEIKFKENTIPKLTNKRLYLALIDKDSTVKVASYSLKHDRIYEFEKNKFILVEDIVKYNMLKDYENDDYGICSFRVVREAHNPITYNDTDDIEMLTINIMQQLEKRDKGQVSYIQIEALDNNAHKIVVEKIKEKLLLDNLNVHEFTNTPIETSFIFGYVDKIAKYDKSLVFKEHDIKYPVTFSRESSLFSQISEKDRVVFFPNESFEDSVLQFLKESCEDEFSTEIFITIYRIKRNSDLMKYLVIAAEKGKKINVIVEFKARFDEQHNIETANILKELNCNVYTTQHSMKVHAKILMVKRLVNDIVSYYSFLSTGNFHEGTAKLYTDLGVFTANTTIGQDVECFFHAVDNQLPTVPLSTLYASPKNLKTKIVNLIEQEIIFHKLYDNGRIILKMNSLYNEEIIDRLVQASKAGVKIDLICRGICGVVPDHPSTSNIRVVSLVGRYLEHSRVYYFNNNNNKKVYISSADLLDRNLDHRYELFTPIKDKDVAEILYQYLLMSLNDNTNMYVEQSNRSYTKVKAKSGFVDVQMDTIEILENHKERFIKEKPKSEDKSFVKNLKTMFSK
ncbi:MAG: polyphosphate kinase 1 [Lachnospirales bacterium]